MPKRIILFTPFPPTIGGGGQNLRCALPHLKDVQITWAYLSHRTIEDVPNSIHIGRPLLEDSLFSSIYNFISYSAGSHPAIRSIAKKLLELKADRYWVVAHYEGVAVAEELIKAGADVHVSVHDDPPFALVGRSRRYGFFKDLCEDQFVRVIRGATTIDVCSFRMAKRYEQLYKIQSVAYFPYLPKFLIFKHPPLGNVIRVGFLGTLYSKREALIFAQALRLLQTRTLTPVEWHFWGLGVRQQSWLKELPIPSFFHPYIPESELPEQIAPMDLLYAAYPFDENSAVFCETSHPAKISTYLKAQRPIFAHTPTASSLGDFINDSTIGLVSDSLDPSTIATSLQALLKLPIPPARFAQAREKWYGEENLKRLNNALLGVVQ